MPLPQLEIEIQFYNISLQVEENLFTAIPQGTCCICDLIWYFIILLSKLDANIKGAAHPG